MAQAAQHLHNRSNKRYSMLQFLSNHIAEEDDTANCELWWVSKHVLQRESTLQHVSLKTVKLVDINMSCSILCIALQ